MNFEEEIVSATFNEGVGSVYERIMLKRFFENLVKKYSFKSVLEYKGLTITKGIDNITFLKNNKKVFVFDKKGGRFEKNWPFRAKPRFFSQSSLLERADLVWNFAVVQLEPGILNEMIKFSKKHFLLFVPNFLNWGTPIHLLYHLLTKNRCTHAERGSLKLRTLWGLKGFVQRQRVQVIKAGFIDTPLLPDIGFSLKELKKTLGVRERSDLTRAHTIKDSRNILKNFNLLGIIERLKLPVILQTPFAHHIYILGKVK